MSDISERFASALQSTSRNWRHAVDRRLKCFRMSQASWMTIAMVAKENGLPLSQTELGDRLGLEGGSMVAMIDRLVKSGFVRRELSATDRRVKRVVLTPSGRNVYDEVKSEAAAMREELMVGIDPKKLLIATELLELIQSKLDAAL